MSWPWNKEKTKYQLAERVRLCLEKRRLTTPQMILYDDIKNFMHLSDSSESGLELDNITQYT